MALNAKKKNSRNCQYINRKRTYSSYQVHKTHVHFKKMINNESESKIKKDSILRSDSLIFQFLSVSYCFLVLHCACRVLWCLFWAIGYKRNKPGEEIQISITTDRLQTAGLVSDTSWSLYVCLSCVDSLYFCLSASLPLLSCVCACGGKIF